MKSIWQSKTFWFNLITGVLAIVSEVSNVFPISQHPKLYATVISVGNIILRLITTQPIGVAKSDN